VFTSAPGSPANDVDATKVLRLNADLREKTPVFRPLLNRRATSELAVPHCSLPQARSSSTCCYGPPNVQRVHPLPQIVHNLESKIDEMGIPIGFHRTTKTVSTVQSDQQMIRHPSESGGPAKLETPGFQPAQE